MIEKTLEALSEGIVFAESSDLDALATIRGQLVEVLSWASEESRADMAEIAATACVMVDDIVGKAAPDCDAALAQVSRSVSALQQALREGPEPKGEDGDDRGAILAEFLSDQESAVDEMEHLILAIDETGDRAQIDKLKGRIHTLKGEAGVLGLADVSDMCHALEDAIGVEASSTTVSMLLEAVDWLRRRFDACALGAEPPAPLVLAHAAEEAGSGAEAALAPVPAEGQADAEESADVARPEIEDDPEEESPAYMQPVELTADPELTTDFIVEAMEHLEQVDDQLLALEKNAVDSEAINSVFRAFHTIKGLASFLDLTCVQAVAHEAETMLDLARGGSLNLAGAPLALTFEVNDLIKRLVGRMEGALAAGEPLIADPGIPALMKRLKAIIGGEVLVDAPQAKPAAAAAAPEAPLAIGEAVGERLRESEGPGEGEPAQVREEAPKPNTGAGAPPASANNEGASPADRKKVQVRETIKVDAVRLDELVDTIGELVIAEAMVSQSEELNLDGLQRLPSLLNRMDKITRELQEMAMSLRMVPVGSTFRRMARLARDVANKLGKRIEFVTMGADTELDKTVVDSIGDPLVHMVRNAVDHGIEKSEEDRLAAGKPAAGRVELRAYHQGGSIHIEIEDDGGGLDAKKILAKAIDRGIVSESDKLTESEIYGLIFAPGFSTAAAVTDVSGRGVGLDVVKRNIEALRGSVEITSTLGKGSIFCIRLPLTLAIIDGMVVKVGRERYILPTVSILRMVRPEEGKLTRLFDRGALLQVGATLVPLCRIDELFDIPGAIQDLSRTSAVIVEHAGRQCAFLVDELLGQQQIVIKPLGPALAGMAGLAGGAIMPDGQVGLILDVASLVHLAQTSNSPEGPSAEALEQPIEV